MINNEDHSFCTLSDAKGLNRSNSADNNNSIAFTGVAARTPTWESPGNEKEQRGGGGGVYSIGDIYSISCMAVVVSP